MLQSSECIKAERDALAARVSTLTDERDTAEAGRVALFKRCEKLAVRVKRLEEAAEEMLCCIRVACHQTEIDRFESNWTGAKEAK